MKDVRECLSSAQEFARFLYSDKTTILHNLPSPVVAVSPFSDRGRYVAIESRFEVWVGSYQYTQIPLSERSVVQAIEEFVIVIDFSRASNPNRVVVNFHHVWTPNGSHSVEWNLCDNEVRDFVGSLQQRALLGALVDYEVYDDIND